MDPLLFVLIVALAVIAVGGTWGLAILKGLMRQKELKLQSKVDDPRVPALLESQSMLEARLQQLEEEVSFLRELRNPDPPAQLRPPEDDATEDKERG